jgi:hypothetical protein
LGRGFGRSSSPGFDPLGGSCMAMLGKSVPSCAPYLQSGHGKTHREK